MKKNLWNECFAQSLVHIKLSIKGSSIHIFQGHYWFDNDFSPKENPMKKYP